MINKLPLLVIVGPTATGKTAVSVRVAKILGGEIVSADSMLVYRYMDIGTAKPSLEECQDIAHYMIDVVDPDEPYSVALYKEQAEKCVHAIAKRGKIPLLVGGTGLYVRSITDQYSFKPADTSGTLRQRLFEEAERIGREELYRRLAEVDPVTAAKVHPNNLKRVIRALEVYNLTGQPISSGQNNRTEPKYNLVMFGLILERSLLYRHIEKRVDEMLAEGLAGEVRQLLGRGYDPGLVSMQGLGYKEMAQYILGNTTFEEALISLKQNTRRFAKRQITWFRRDKRIKWLKVSDYKDVQSLAEEIAGYAAGVFKAVSKT